MPGGEPLDLLMAAAQRGDKAAYRTFLIEGAAMLRGFYRRRLRDDALAEDLVQETLMAVHAKRATCDPERGVAPWFYAIARYKLVDHWRRSGRASEVDIDEQPLEATEFSDADIDIETLLSQLPPAQAQAIRQTKIEGRTGSELAAEEGISESAIKLRVHRGLAQLRALVAGGQP